MPATEQTVLAWLNLGAIISEDQLDEIAALTRDLEHIAEQVGTLNIGGRYEPLEWAFYSSFDDYNVGEDFYEVLDDVVGIGRCKQLIAVTQWLLNRGDSGVLDDYAIKTAHGLGMPNVAAAADLVIDARDARYPRPEVVPDEPSGDLNPPAASAVISAVERFMEDMEAARSLT